jgi:elongation factor Ts
VVVLQGGSAELAHDIAVHVAFAKPQYLDRGEVPDDVVAEERATLLNITKAEGKPEAAWPKIVEGRLNGWYKERVLLDQAFVRDDKQTIAQLAASSGATIVRFAQLYIGG